MIYDANGKPAPRTTYRLGIFEWLAILSAALLYFFAWFSPAHGVEPNVQLSPGPVLLTSMPQASPDSQWAVYADAAGLWSVQLHGGPSTLLAALGSRQLFGAAKITPDSLRVVFIADLDVLGKPELFSVPITGGSPTRISKAMAADRHVRDFLISPTSQRVYYAADGVTNNVIELWRVGVAGGPSTRLNASISGNYDVFEYHVTPSDQVVYRVGRSTVGGHELWTVPGNGRGSQARRISRAMVDGGGVQSDWTISGEQVVYRCDCEDNGEFNLYSVPIAGGTSIRLNAVLGGVGDFRTTVSGGSETVTYEQTHIGVESWFSVLVTGGAPVPVPPPVEPPVTSADGRWTAHHAASVLSLTRGACTTQIGMPVVTTFLAKPAYSITPDSKRVVFISGGEVWTSSIYGAVCALFINGFESGSTEAWQ